MAFLQKELNIKNSIFFFNNKKIWKFLNLICLNGFIKIEEQEG
jgi:hypothetical protein